MADVARVHIMLAPQSRLKGREVISNGSDCLSAHPLCRSRTLFFHFVERSRRTTKWSEQSEDKVPDKVIRSGANHGLFRSPIFAAATNPLAFASVSSYSASGMESATIPAPA